MGRKIILSVILLSFMFTKMEGKNQYEVPPSLILYESLEDIRQQRFDEEVKKVLEIKEELQRLENERLEKEKLEKEEHEESSIFIDRDFEALVQATWRLETGNGSSELWRLNNNAGGIRCGKVYCSYESKSVGMASLRRLLQGYVNKHGYDLEAIRNIYSESNDTELFRQIYNEEKGKIK